MTSLAQVSEQENEKCQTHSIRTNPIHRKFINIRKRLLSYSKKSNIIKIKIWSKTKNSKKIKGSYT
jgi:hypothetical protein